jgi:hypothetical protein
MFKRLVFLLVVLGLLPSTGSVLFAINFLD